jgi:hypothetical protein
MTSKKMEDDLKFLTLEDNLKFFKIDDALILILMEDDLQHKYGRQPQTNK